MKLLVKLGGTLLDDATVRKSLAGQIARLKNAGHEVVVVHGGGKQLTRFLEKQGIESRFVNGLRVTGPEAMEAVLQVLAGSVNRYLVAALVEAGVRAVGISGIDAGMVTAARMSEELGLVGKVQQADMDLVEHLCRGGFTPVIACVAGDGAGECFNINADQMASACAVGFFADRLVFLTDVGGVMEGSGNVMSTLSVVEAEKLIRDGVARGGMQAKLNAAMAAIHGGVRSVLIAPGAVDGILARAVLETAEGTRLVA